MLTVLTQKPPFSIGNVCLLTSAATAALQEEPQASHSENGNQPNRIDNREMVIEAKRLLRLSTPKWRLSPRLD
jgi:hypothetical protein